MPSHAFYCCRGRDETTDAAASHRLEAPGCSDGEKMDESVH